jgi:hypothetical protein
VNQTDWTAISTAYAAAVEKAWTDPQFRSQLLSDPRAALTAQGASIPPDVDIRVVENTDEVVHLVLPPPPSGGLS